MAYVCVRVVDCGRVSSHKREPCRVGRELYAWIQVGGTISRDVPGRSSTIGIAKGGSDGEVGILGDHRRPFGRRADVDMLWWYTS